MKLDIDNILENMTIEEKTRLVNGDSFFGMDYIERLGVPRMQLLDGGTGINFEQLFGDMYSREGNVESTNGMVGATALTHVIDCFYEPDRLNDMELEMREFIVNKLEERTGAKDMAPGCFPPGILLGATFDKEIVEQVGEALGIESRLYGVNVLLGSPNVNIHRDPRNGRLFEGYSEDPCLVATLAPELVKGVQKFKVAANVKHFAANNQEYNRVGINETISERALQEIYFPGFKACVKEGRVETVMSAYNKINGIACTRNSWILTKLLREEWGFKGAVVSDWGAVYEPVEAVQAGNDLAMPGPIDNKVLLEAVKEGKLTEKELDVAVRRLLKLINYCSEPLEKDILPKNNANQAMFDSVTELTEYTDNVAYRAAVAGIVMLKNENEIFPIRFKRVVVIGSGSEKMLECGTGSAGITTNRGTSFVEELKKEIGEENVIKDISSADLALVVASVGGMEGNDRDDIYMDKDDRALLDSLIVRGIRVGLILNTSGPVDISDYEPYIDGIFSMFLPGMQGAKAMAHILSGRCNPSGKLPVTFPMRIEDTPSYVNFPGDGYQVNYGEGIYVGYRYYDTKKIQPRYPFGYGLSYSKFRFHNIACDRVTFTDELNVDIEIANVSSVAGAEVIQVYIHDVVSTISKPYKELKTFKKVHLAAGERITLDKHMFESYDGDYHKFIAEEGEYDIIVASSSGEKDVKAIKRVYLEGKSEYSYGINSTVKVMYEHSELKKALYDLWNREKWDIGIVESNYQYTSSHKLVEILPENIEVLRTKDSYKRFIETIEKVRK